MNKRVNDVGGFIAVIALVFSAIVGVYTIAKWSWNKLVIEPNENQAKEASATSYSHEQFLEFVDPERYSIDHIRVDKGLTGYTPKDARIRLNKIQNEPEISVDHMVLHTNLYRTNHGGKNCIATYQTDITHLNKDQRDSVAHQHMGFINSKTLELKELDKLIERNQNTSIEEGIKKENVK